MNFLDFFFLDFYLIFILFPYLKREKWVNSARLAEMTWRAGPARMQRDTQGHVIEPRESTRTPGWHHVAVRGLVGEGPTG